LPHKLVQPTAGEGESNLEAALPPTEVETAPLKFIAPANAEPLLAPSSSKADSSDGWHSVLHGR
jgi:hypothetical protein